jgi:hypothetical protein
MTRVERMSHVAKPHGYWRCRSGKNEGVYIVTSPTHYPLNRLTGIQHCGEKLRNL